MKSFLKKNWFFMVCAVLVVCVLAWMFHRAEEMDKKRPHYNKENPKETQWGELTFADQTNGGEALPLCTELTAEDKCQFAPETEYRIHFDYPDALKAELENGRSNYEVDIEYSFEVEAGKLGYLRITIYSQETNKMYRGESSFGALGDLCLKHDIAATPDLGEEIKGDPIKFVGSNYLEFTLFTSATPDDGPKRSFSAWKTTPVWKIAGVEGEF